MLPSLSSLLRNDKKWLARENRRSGFQSLVAFSRRTASFFGKSRKILKMSRYWIKERGSDTPCFFVDKINYCLALKWSGSNQCVLLCGGHHDRRRRKKRLGQKCGNMIACLPAARYVCMVFTVNEGGHATNHHHHHHHHGHNFQLEPFDSNGTVGSWLLNTTISSDCCCCCCGSKNKLLYEKGHGCRNLEI